MGWVTIRSKTERKGAQERLGVALGHQLVSRGTTLLLRALRAKKSIAKRFKLTARGKLVRRTPGFRHLLGSKSTKQKRRATRDKLVAAGHAEALKRALPFGL